MPIYQAWNQRNKAYIKYHFKKDGKIEWLDVKQREPTKPFKGIKIRGNNKK